MPTPGGRGSFHMMYSRHLPRAVGIAVRGNKYYRRKNFWAEKKKSWRLNFSIRERKNLYWRKNFFLSAKELLG